MARLNRSLDPKLTDSVISILQSKKIFTVFEFVNEDSEKVMQYSGLTYQEILGLKQKITRLYLGGIKRGSELLKTNYKNEIRTEIKSLDNLLKGGLNRGEIYEICGISSSGKSQLCHTVAVNVAQKFNEIVHYVDTKGDFCARRTHAIIKNKKLSEDHEALILDNIIVTKIERGAEELMSFLHNLVKELKIKCELNKCIQLLIIDSLPAIFFNCNIDSLPSSNNSRLNQFSNLLKCLASEFNIPVITTNLITQWRENIAVNSNAKSIPLVRKPSLGRFWYSIPNTRLFIETIESEKRKIAVWKSPCILSGSDCLVNITDAGVI